MAHETYKVMNKEGNQIKGKKFLLFDILLSRRENRVAFPINSNSEELYDLDGGIAALVDLNEYRISFVAPNEICIDNVVIKIENDLKGKYKFEKAEN